MLKRKPFIIGLKSGLAFAVKEFKNEIEFKIVSGIVPFSIRLYLYIPFFE